MLTITSLYFILILQYSGSKHIKPFYIVQDLVDKLNFLDSYMYLIAQDELLLAASGHAASLHHLPTMQLLITISRQSTHPP